MHRGLSSPQKMRRWLKEKLGSRDALIVFGLVAVFAAIVGFALRPPGLDLQDGQNDHGQNGVAVSPLWISSGAPTQRVISEFARAVRENRIAEIFVPMPPPNADGTLPGLDSAPIETLLYECYDARGWARIDIAKLAFDDPLCRRFFIADLRRLLDRHPRLRGIELDLSQIPDVSPALLTLLDELRPILAADSRPLALSVRLWDQPYFREVARRADRLIVPLAVSASPFSRFSVQHNAECIGSALAWCEGKPVFISLPGDQRLRRALSTVHWSLSRWSDREHFRGIILDASASLDSAAWSDLRTHFLRP